MSIKIIRKELYDEKGADTNYSSTLANHDDLTQTILLENVTTANISTGGYVCYSSLDITKYADFFSEYFIRIKDIDLYLDSTKSMYKCVSWYLKDANTLYVSICKLNNNYIPFGSVIGVRVTLIGEKTFYVCLTE